MISFYLFVKDYDFLSIKATQLYGVVNAKAHSLTFSTLTINHTVIHNTTLLHHSFPRSMNDQRGATHAQTIFFKNYKILMNFINTNGFTEKQLVIHLPPSVDGEIDVILTVSGLKF